MFIRALAFLWLVTQLGLGQQPTPIVPDPKLTPGDAFDVTAQDLCVPGYAKKVRNVPEEMRQEVYREYGITYHGKGEYEIDHLISLDFARTRRFKFDKESMAGILPNFTLERPSQRSARKPPSRACMRWRTRFKDRPTQNRSKLDRGVQKIR